MKYGLPPFCLSVWQGVFLDFFRFFLNFDLVLQTHIKLCVTEPDIPEKKICPKNWENGSKKGQKQCFLNLLKKIVNHFYWIRSMMKIPIIGCVPAQIPYLGINLFLKYRPKYSQPIRFQDFLINRISRTISEIAWYFECWYKFT